MRDKVKIDGEVITRSEVSGRAEERKRSRSQISRRAEAGRSNIQLRKRRKQTEATDSGSRPEVQRKCKRWRKPESHVQAKRVVPEGPLTISLFQVLFWALGTTCLSVVVAAHRHVSVQFF
jgi:hypothetical protein